MRRAVLTLTGCPRCSYAVRRCMWARHVAIQSLATGGRPTCLLDASSTHKRSSALPMSSVSLCCAAAACRLAAACWQRSGQAGSSSLPAASARKLLSPAAQCATAASTAASAAPLAGSAGIRAAQPASVGVVRLAPGVPGRCRALSTLCIVRGRASAAAFSTASHPLARGRLRPPCMRRGQVRPGWMQDVLRLRE